MVTGDAVVLDVQIAQLPVRAVSAHHRYRLDLRLLVPGIGDVGSFPVAVRRRVDRRVPDHLHRAGDGRLSGGHRDGDPGPLGGQDGDGSAGGLRRRRPGTLPPGAVSRAGRGDRDLDAAREPRRDLQRALAQGQAGRRHVRRHRRRQRTRSPDRTTTGHATSTGGVGGVIAALRADLRPGRSRPPIPLPGTSARSGLTQPDGLSDRR